MGEPREIDYRAGTRILHGLTCDDCAHTRRCNLLGYTSPGGTACDFYSSRFRIANAPDLAAERK